MTRRKFGSEFKIEAVKLVTERGVKPQYRAKACSRALNRISRVTAS